MSQPKHKVWLNGYKNKTPIYVVYKRPTSKQGVLKKQRQSQVAKSGTASRVHLLFHHKFNLPKFHFKWNPHLISF